MLGLNFLFPLTLLVAYVAIAVQIPPYNTDLKIKTNDLFRDGKKTEYIVYTSVVEYNKDTAKLSNEQLAGLGKQAWDEMKNMHAAWANSCGGGKKKFVESHRPGMMSGIAVGNQIYFSSSMKKNTPNILLQHADSILSQDMIRCTAAWWPKDPKADSAIDLHRNYGNCGELMAQALFIKLNGKKIQDSGLPAKIVAFGTDGETVQNPCSDEKDFAKGYFGCWHWATYSKIEWVPKGTVPQQVNDAPVKYHDVDLKGVWNIKENIEVDPLTAEPAKEEPKKEEPQKEEPKKNTDL